MKNKKLKIIQSLLNKISSNLLMKKFQILIVDDDVELLSSLNEILISSGYETVQAADGNEALEKFDPKAIDLVITNIVMPGIDGFELLKEIKKISPQTPVIIHTAGFYRNEYITEGASSVLIKPSLPNEILLHIERALATKKLRSELEEKTEQLKEAKLEIHKIRSQLETVSSTFTVDNLDTPRTNELMQTIIEASPIPFIVTRKADGKVLFANEPLYSMVGVKPEELYGLSTIDFYKNPEDRDEIVKKINRDGYIKNREVMLKKSDGGSIWMILNLVSTIIAGEEVVLGGLYDIDERKNAEQKLELYKQIFMASNDSIMIIDSEQKIIDRNPAHQRISGLNDDEIIGKDIKEKLSPKMQLKIENALKRNGFFRGEMFFFTKDGDKQYVDMALNPIHNDKGELIYYMSVGRDINERKKAEELIAARLRYEKGIAGCSQALLEQGDTDKILKNALNQLLQAADVERVCLIENIDDAKQGLCMVHRFEICAENVPNVFNGDDEVRIPYKKGFEEWEKSLSTDLYLAGLVKDRPESERKVFGKTGVKSFIVIPVFVKGNWYGFIGFDDLEKERTWGEEEIRLLRTAADMIGGFIHRRQAVEALRVSEERYRSLVENANDIIYSVNKKGEFTYLSPKFEDFTGFKASEFIGKSNFGIIHKDDVDTIRNWLTREALKGNTEDYEFRIIDKKGKIRWLVSRSSVIRNNTGEVIEITGVAHDITEMKKVLDDLEKANLHLRKTQAQLVQSEKMASLGMLVAGIAHEINTPMGAVNSMHDTLVRAIDKMDKSLKETFGDEFSGNDKFRKTINIIEDANRVIKSGTERVTNIIRRLRSFARLDEAELKDADLHEGLKDTISLLHHELKHEVEIKLDLGEIPVIACYPGRLNQVFMNIIVNARQAIKGKGEIIIRTYHKAKKIYIEIEDNGSGMPKNILGKVFDPGFTTKGVGVGTGLGLSICYQIIQDHHGEIKVEIEAGKGSKFTIIIPTDLEKG